ncbi:hypothetical protein ACFOEZ_10085 [Tianweitania populi]|uniref:Uncharacterized protein n=1 Tax=Tianweitania populi TaxID=1607949 RepID=A0A8J3DVC3_9HYPH|nr:hypothetical protein [Tianweitania populi]GHD24445.1 hypothetical protein GCM10016234_40660 [Tianweitania populi]
MMILLFPLFLGLSIIAVVADAVRAGSVRGIRGGLAFFSVCLLLCYVLAFALISLDPYFDDNGAPSFIDLRFRWFWAAELAGWIALLFLPTAFALRAAVKGVRVWLRRTSENEGIAATTEEHIRE